MRAVCGCGAESAVRADYDFDVRAVDLNKNPQSTFSQKAFQKVILAMPKTACNAVGAIR